MKRIFQSGVVAVIAMFFGVMAAVPPAAALTKEEIYKRCAANASTTLFVCRISGSHPRHSTLAVFQTCGTAPVTVPSIPDHAADPRLLP